MVTCATRIRTFASCFAICDDAAWLRMEVHEMSTIKLRRRLVLVGLPLLGAALAAGVAAEQAHVPASAQALAPAATKPVPTGLGGKDWTTVKTSTKIVALTFDAGSNADGVASILATLKADRVPASFFLTGQFVQNFPGKARDIVRSGARIGDHSVTHPKFTTLTDAQMRAQVVDAQKKIISVTGAESWPWFRFPFGDRNAHTISVVNSVGFVPVRWTVDTLGWKGKKGITVAGIVKRILDNLKPGEIVLMHCGSAPDGSTLDADALPTVIKDLQDRGYSFVTLDAMLGYRVLTSNGDVHAYGSARFGSMAGKLSAGVTAMGLAADRRTGGYWMLKSNGGVNFFNAPWYGSLMGKLPDGVTAQAIASGRNDGYLVLTSDGDVHAYNRPSFGSDLGSLPDGVTAVGLAIDTATGGYWIVRSDGGVDGFNAPVSGSLLGQVPSGVRVTGLAASPTGGYYVLTSDGQVHPFGAPSLGSLFGKLPAGVTAVGLATDVATGGYWILKSNGGVNDFRAPWYGSLAGQLTKGQRVTGIIGQ
jgi:peptidoglycan/xylan/chitin deacetylase (PgdA/CDA1 family)